MVKKLDEIDELVLGHIARYRLTDPEILGHTDLFAESGSGDAAAVLKRLEGEGWLCSGELIPETPGNIIYCLSTMGAERLGQNADLARPLKREARLEWYAIAKFCCCGNEYRQLFTKEEFKTQFQDLWHAGQPVRYYLEPDGSGSARLAFIKVDVDGQGRWDRLIDSCNRFLQQRIDSNRVSSEHRARSEAYARLVERGRFQFTILTALDDKKRAIEIEMERRELAGERVSPIKVYVMPGLFELMFPAQKH